MVVAVVVFAVVRMVWIGTGEPMSHLSQLCIRIGHAAA